ncbi:MAG TPA: hypothetical protein VME19_19875 [Streptosporangiaceae bacterium]|nr:hypothetical protein [Streptosporangiaceae bacterium]
MRRNTYGHAYVPHGIMQILPFWDYRYPMTFARVSAVAAVALVLAGGILCSVGAPWGAALFAAAALRFWISRELVRCARA